MPRDLTVFDRNELTLRDSVSGTDIVFYHRTPTTADRVRYQAARYRRDGTRLVMCFRSAAIAAGAGVLTGIREGDFTLGRDESGQPVPLSSDPASPHYRPDWKDHVEAMAGDLLFILGHVLFEGQVDTSGLAAVQLVDEADGAEPPADEEDGGEITPLATSSGD